MSERIFRRDQQPFGRVFELFPTEARAEADGESGAPRVTFILSTGGPKRDGNVIDQKGWDLANYRKNPQVLWAHDYSGRWGGYVPTIGKSEREWVEGDSLRSTAQFCPKDLYELGYTVGRMVQAGFLNAVSVGWDPLEWTYDEQLGGYRFIRQELLEYSVVPVPADPDALAQRAHAQGIDLRSYVEGLARSLDGEAVFPRIPRGQLEPAWRGANPARPRFHDMGGLVMTGDHTGELKSDVLRELVRRAMQP